MASRSADARKSGLQNVPTGDKIVVLMRHGETAFNKEPSRMRGHLDVPLNEVGVGQAVRAAKEICAAHKIAEIFASDLSRSHDVARILAAQCGAEVNPAPWARTWNLGTLQGEYVDDIVPLLKNLTTSMRNLPAPAGESFNDFLIRWIGGLKATIQHAPTDGRSACVVSHIQNMVTAKAWVKAGCPTDLKGMTYVYSNDDEVDPGDFFSVVVDPRGKTKIVESRN